ncbi:MAG: hypothetical protein ACFFD2_01295 [Promethearchaeota archaeon]
MPKSIDEIAGKIMNDMEKLLLERVYLAILKSGKVLYASTTLDKHIDLLKLFAITEFKELNILDHAFPLAGMNLIVFKINDDILLCLYTKKSNQEKLISFKNKIAKYTNDLEVAVKLYIKTPIKTESKGQILPKLVKNVSLSLGMSDDESRVLKLCDGSHSIKEIIDKTLIPRKKIVEIIQKFEEKEWLKIEFKGEVDLIPVSIKKTLDTSVRVGFSQKSANINELKSFAINELCDGINTIQDISDELNIPEKDLIKILKKMERKKIIKIKVKIPEEEPIISEIPAEKVEIPKPEEILSPELNIEDELKSEYQRANLEEKVGIISTSALEKAIEILEGPISAEDDEIKEKILKYIQEELPLMPSATQIKIVDKLMKSPVNTREDVLKKLINSESSKKFKRFNTLAPSGPAASTTPSDSPLTSSSSPSTPIIGSLREKIATLSDSIPPTQSEIPSDTKSLGNEIATEDDQVNEVLNVIDSLLGIPEILYVALIDFKGTIFYQTTREAKLMDITKDVLKLITNWNMQAPSVYIRNVKYATIKATEKMLIATNIKGLGHIVAMSINEDIFIFAKLSQAGDVLLISDDIAIVAKQINEMF